MPTKKPKISQSSQRTYTIGVVIDQLLAGGVQLAAIEQVRQLRKLGQHATLLILMRKRYPIDFSHLVDGVPHLYLSDSYPPSLRQTVKLPIFNFLSTLHLVSPLLAPPVIKPGQYDILVSWGTTTCLTTQAIFRKRKIPYIAIIPDPIDYILEHVYSKTSLSLFFPLLKRIAKYFEASFVKDASQVVIISKVHAPYLVKHYGRKPIVLHLGVHPPPSLPTKRGKELLSFGRWEKEKNPTFLLHLIKKIPKVQLTIAGTWMSDDELIWFRNRIKSERLSKRVSVIDHYTAKSLAKLCSRARLWVHPHFEAFGLAALEAAGHGLPIVIPEKSGVTEKFTSGIHGFFPGSVDLKEYLKFVRLLLTDERLAFRMGIAASQVVKRDFTWTTNVKKLLHLITYSIDKKPSTQVAVIEIGHTQGTTLSGGDKLMEPMATRLTGNYSFTIIVSHLGSAHWKQAQLTKKMRILPRNRFDGFSDPVSVFLTYCHRMWTASFALWREKDAKVIYSSTNILPDVLPAFVVKRFRPQALWIARIHHLIPPPHKREGKPIVNIVSYLMQWLALVMIRTGADTVIALNESLKSQLLTRGFSRRNLEVLGAGIDLRHIGTGKDRSNIGQYEGVFLGRLHPTKGIFDLIPIWRRVINSHPQARLAVIGGGQEYLHGFLERLIAKAGLAGNVRLLGQLPDSEVYALMRKAKIFLFTDHEAGWGLAVAEAMACGLPVVGFDTGVLGSVYRRGFRKVPLGDIDGFARETQTLLDKPRLRARLVAEAISQMRSLDWNTTTRQFERILVKTMSREG
ncbi:MAG: hypothetical protein A2785_02310 [Candidatus Chisholmbacteria bacterium RIFCSPHIGHO2_01_FULL_49_18]|uniref:Glycosyl transferase family 1 domain-containing protein n=2 Tax=Candidatus Chisholmiibacteriota TaxID=1817900 RepID=A0A1G1VNH0_9BACT|nr:MAG: hypothetical protein A2785_02310 [Candidatus Chisholmbacteria bacterium RIFCSPHIGHO2_01_FULL_49_18]OGY21551.1 MAG: hypothetical protein A3A65_05525 [Candidatus Chisholmbacteria bacterium RIFCSPLOWO2_01_FULL_49_14]